MAEFETSLGVSEDSLESEYRAKEQRLLGDLESLVGLLLRFREERWAAVFSAQRRDLDDAVRGNTGRKRKAAIAQAIRALFVAPRPFGDLIIHPLNGHDVGSGEISRTNRRLDALRNSVYALAWLYDDRRFCLCDLA